jgi:anti-sigma B factor antagonist
VKPPPFCPGLLYVEVTSDVAVVKITSRNLDYSNTEPIVKRLSDLVDRLGGHKLQLDLNAVEYLTSEVLGKLVGLNRRVRAAGGELCLYNVQPLVYEIFEVTHLTGVLNVRSKESGQTHVASA